MYSSAAFAAEDDQAGAEASSTGFGDIIVTARRQEESLQSVPVAVSVIDNEKLESQGTFRPENIAEFAPGLSVSGGGDTDRGNIIFSIRGQSFTYGALFPSVITYFNDVPTKYLSVGQFYDSESLQILRGPQGVQFGRVTNGGNVMLTPKKPTNDLSADVTLKAGNYALKATTGFINLPVVDDTLAVRFSWDAADRKGFTKNLYDGKRRDDVGYYGGRLGVLFTPGDRFENYFVAQFQRTSDNGTGIFLTDINPTGIANAVGSLFPLVNLASELSALPPAYWPAGFTGGYDPIYGINPDTGAVGAYGFNGNTLPLNVDNYVAALQQHVDQQNVLGKRKIYSTAPQFNKRKYLYLVNTMSFDITDNIQLKNILGYTRYIERSAQNYDGGNSGYIQPCHDLCPFQPNKDVPFYDDEQYSAELRLAGKSFDGRLNWSIGGYMDKQKPAGLRENDTIYGGILEYLLVQRAVTKSKAVYGYAEFDVTDKLKINGGIRYTHDTITSQNQNYNALLPVPGLEDMLTQNLILFGTDAAYGAGTSAYLASLAANSAASINHGVCEDYNFGTFEGECTTTKGKFNSTTWTFGASYELGPRQLIYAKYSKGYRPGGVNATFPAGFETLRAFQPETNFSLEGGIKADWNLGSMPVRTNLSVYKDRYKNIQNAIGIRDEAGNPGSIVLNASGANIWGIEFEGSVKPIDGLTIGVNYAYTDAKYKKDGISEADINNAPPAGTVLDADFLFSSAADPYRSYLACNPDGPALGFCTLNRLPIVPKHQLGVNFQWDFVRDSAAGTFGIGGNWYYQSSAAVGSTAKNFLEPGAIEKGYDTLNLTANWNNMLGKPIDLLFFMTNVTDEVHRVMINANRNLADIGNLSNVYSPPRMWGAAITAHF